MMKHIFVSVIVIAGLCILAARGAQGAMDESAVAAFSTAAPVSITVLPSFLESGVDHVANGVALRNRCIGTIQLRGIPPGSTVRRALLYWNYMDGFAVGASSDTELFNGNGVRGTKVADQRDLCWGTKGDHTYRALVTGLVPTSTGPGDYTFSALRCNDASGSNPWVGGSAGPVLW
jgi:hypothetical protein